MDGTMKDNNMNKYLYIKSLLNLKKNINDLIDQEILKVTEGVGNSEKFKEDFSYKTQKEIRVLPNNYKE